MKKQTTTNKVKTVKALRKLTETELAVVSGLFDARAKRKERDEAKEKYGSKSAQYLELREQCKLFDACNGDKKNKRNVDLVCKLVRNNGMKLRAYGKAVDTCKTLGLSVSLNR